VSVYVLIREKHKGNRNKFIRHLYISLAIGSCRNFHRGLEAGRKKKRRKSYSRRNLYRKFVI